MAKDTKTELRNLIIYSVYVRNHTEEGTFRALIPDLERIRALGTDVVWLMPIHPIGEKCRKGTLGSPYANRDYRAINPEFGTMDDFRALADAVHRTGMKLMIDVVYNHTAPDSVLWNEHPEWFYHRPDGTPGNHIGEWSDIIDLDYTNPGLWDYQIETLKMWAEIVDGFRCDVAPFVPVPFWLRAREEIKAIKPDFIWLGESIHLSFGNLCRRRGLYAARDTELFEAFDMEYEYDIREVFDRLVDGKATVSNYTDMLDMQEALYPENYIKMRCLENHDRPRIASQVPDEKTLENYTAMLFFLKGSTLLYGGQEVMQAHLPALFDKDPIDWNTGHDLTPYLRKLVEVKKTVLHADDGFTAAADDEHAIAIMEREYKGVRKIGVFSLRAEEADVAVDLPDGVYENVIDGSSVSVTNGMLRCEGKPIILRTEEEGRPL